MASLAGDASADDLEEELILQQTLLESLGDAPDDDSGKVEITKCISALEQRLRELDGEAGQPTPIDSPGPEVVDSNDSDASLSISERPSKRMASPTLTGRDPKRHAANVARAQTERAAATAREYLVTNRALGKLRAAEEAAERRKRAAQADAAFAAQLSSQAEGLSSSSSSASFQPSYSHARSLDTANLPSEQHPPQTSYQSPVTVKPEGQHRANGPTPVQNWHGALVDLTLDDSDSSTNLGREAPIDLTMGRYARTPQELVDAVHDMRSTPGSSQTAHVNHNHRTTMDRLMMAQNFEAQRRAQAQAEAQAQARARERAQAQAQAQAQARADEQAQFQARVRLLAQLRNQIQTERNPQRRGELLARYNAELLRRNRQQTDRVYDMPGAFPGASGASSSIYEPQSRSPSFFSSVGPLGQALSSYHDDLMRVGEALGITGPNIKRSAWESDNEEAYDDAETMEALKNLMDSIRPDEEIPIDEQDVEVEGMTVRLKPYQGAGLKWLQSMEDGTNKGGILADDMGLGKTVQAIALMATRRSEETACKTNLIVAPLALLKQWKDEIESKLMRGRHAMKVFIHHGSTKKRSWEELRAFDVVITTFGTLASEMRKHDNFEKRKKINPDATEKPSERCIFIGDRANWYRVIIDEAQNIKNQSTQSARGACMLRSKFRLCMTGTPMMNNVDELYSLVRFLRIKPYNDYKKFSKDFSRPIKSSNKEGRMEAMQRLQVLLKAILLRRQKKSTINGKPILILPERIVEETNTEFTVEERDFYKALETQSRITFNRYVQAGTVGKSYAHILVMLLRLRQACCHPHLIKDFGVAMAADISQETMDDIARGLNAMTVERIKASGGEFECPVCYDGVQNPAIFVPCGHDTCPDCYVKIKDQAAESTERGGAKCPNCRGAIDPQKVIDYETFKKIHMPQLAIEEATEAEADSNMRAQGSSTESETEGSDSGSDTDDDDADDEDGDDDDEIDDSDSETEDLDGFIVYDDEVANQKSEPSSAKHNPPTRPGGLTFSDSESETLSENETVPRRDKGKQPVRDEPSEVGLVDSSSRMKNGKKAKKRRRNGKGKKKSAAEKTEKPKKKQQTQRTLAELKKLASRNKAAKREYLSRLRRDFIPSAKIEKTMELVKQIMEDTDEKVIIFSQWTSLLDLLEIPIDNEGWVYERYDGSMSSRHRTDAIDNFKDKAKRPQVRLMLVSLKAGNAGLNLNCASQVIILDPFWNPYIEEQAIDRAHRLGQEKEVHVHRLLVAETVEDRIMALQEQKRAMINEALDENAGQKLSRLGQRQLEYLFGVRRELPAASG